jgi:hypothetical protein
MSQACALAHSDLVSLHRFMQFEEEEKQKLIEETHVSIVYHV